jgi:hypothetical protein
MGFCLPMAAGTSRDEPKRSIVSHRFRNQPHLRDLRRGGRAAEDDWRCRRRPPQSYWTQATSDVSGPARDVRTATIGAAYGDAFLAALAIGDVSRETILGGIPSLRGSSHTPPKPTFTEVATTYFASSISGRAGLMENLER